MKRPLDYLHTHADIISLIAYNSPPEDWGYQQTKMAHVRQISVTVVVAIICNRRKRKRKANEVWEREWLKRRTERGVHRQLLEELRLELPEILTDGNETISGEVVNGFPYQINKYGTRFGAVFF